MIFLCNLIKIQNRLDAFPVALHNIARENSVFFTAFENIW